MVEFALVLSLQLFVILGGIQLGLLILDRTRLTHAAQEAAIAGAEPDSDCDDALVTATIVYGEAPDASECREQVGFVEVGLGHRIARLLPFLPDFVTVSARAAVRP